MTGTAEHTETTPDNTPARRCSYPLGCHQPPLEGRHYCHRHAAQVQHRAAELIKDSKKKRK